MHGNPGSHSCFYTRCVTQQPVRPEAAPGGAGRGPGGGRALGGRAAAAPQPLGSVAVRLPHEHGAQLRRATSTQTFGTRTCAVWGPWPGATEAAASDPGGSSIRDLGTQGHPGPRPPPMPRVPWCSYVLGESKLSVHFTFSTGWGVGAGLTCISASGTVTLGDRQLLTHSCRCRRCWDVSSDACLLCP